MKFKILDNVIRKMINVLESIGKTINQNFTEEETKKIQKVHSSKQTPWEKKINEPIPEGPQGKSSKAKGNANTDAVTFNHPRKSVSQGRRH